MQGAVFVLCGVLWLGFTFPSQAASFDCSKASTAVEKMICADAELSKLDEKMAAAYTEALQIDEKQAASLRQEQKQWMKKRDACADAVCVHGVYQARLQGLTKDGMPPKYPAQEKAKSNFSGQWHMELCDKDISDECGGFTVYLIQTGEKICGDHFFATPGMGRLNEGAPRSIVGSVTGHNVANVIITSGRNGAIYRVRMIKDGDTLNWKIIEEIKPGSEGDSALVLASGNLKRDKMDKYGYLFKDSSSECKK